MKYEDVDAALQRLAKWRAVFAGWQLGTRAKGDPESDAVRDHREVTILMRAELNALLGILVKKGIVTTEEWTIALGEEAEYLNGAYEKMFPGIRATADGITIDHRAVEFMRNWKP